MITKKQAIRILKYRGQQLLGMMVWTFMIIAPSIVERICG